MTYPPLISNNMAPPPQASYGRRDLGKFISFLSLSSLSLSLSLSLLAFVCCSIPFFLPPLLLLLLYMSSYAIKQP